MKSLLCKRTFNFNYISGAKNISQDNTLNCLSASTTCLVQIRKFIFTSVVAFIIMPFLVVEEVCFAL